MFLDFLFIIRLSGVEAPSGDQVLGINMSSQKGEHRHFDSYTREPRLHLTPASHLLSRSAPVLTQCEAGSHSWSSVYTCPGLTATHRHGGRGRDESIRGSGKSRGRGSGRCKKKKKKHPPKNKKLMEISCGEAGAQ